MSSESRALAPRPLRLWPGVLAAVLLLLVRFGVPVVMPEQTLYAVIGGFAGTLAIALWWLFFSRAPWLERVGAVVLTAVGIAVMWPLVHVSISTGAMGGLFPMLAVPPLAVALVVWAAATQGLSNGARRASMAATILVACGAWTLAKTGGFTAGDFDNDLMWRWSQSPEDRLVADASAALPLAPAAPPAPREIAAALPVNPETRSPTSDVPHHDEDAGKTAVAHAHHGGETLSKWPGFRGLLRDGIVRGVRIETDWTKSPPVALWRRPIGPGWSSFAVHGDLIYTQEQRGEDEIVASYNLTTGKPVWSHRDAARFWESNGGAGPRGTPTFSSGRIYAFGATGILNALDAASGALIWSRNVAGETQTPVPTWGFSSSPLVVDDLVIIGASGTLAAYDLATGTPRWVGPDRALTEYGSYSSPQRLTIDGVDQIVLLSEAGATSVSPTDGTVFWEHALAGGPIIQPALTTDGDLLIQMMSMTGDQGISRLTVRHEPGGWTTKERWRSAALKTMFNDFVIHKGYAFGFDGSILTCVNLEDGKRKWKGGRYGSGQLVLLPDQDVLVVLSEEGALALVRATPDQFTQIARVPAIEGKTWNHPVLVDDVLLVRNGEEMAAFRLSLLGR